MCPIVERRPDMPISFVDDVISFILHSQALNQRVMVRVVEITIRLSVILFPHAFQPDCRALGPPRHRSLPLSISVRNVRLRARPYWCLRRRSAPRQAYQWIRLFLGGVRLSQSRADGGVMATAYRTGRSGSCSSCQRASPVTSKSGGCNRDLADSLERDRGRDDVQQSFRSAPLTVASFRLSDQLPASVHPSGRTAFARSTNSPLRIN